ncbi:hypothetical protein JAAARDRAFT_686851 [Jaapia argillacea MUCL 33604]|uniref:histone deacetylase n=1 Tax=Jaapia argillacea MUCL 33604 TaxID=933084 RepID=A0A067PS20_9AGAM|nr:hypothetical protein JAAARDRAFT_686851 [Jaapia argillacea MUCL 33604]
MAPKFTVGVVYSPDMMYHSPSHAYASEDDHPERPERIARIFEAIKQAQLLPKMKTIAIRKVKQEEALLVHSRDHWDKVLSIALMTPQDIADSQAFYEGLSLYVHPYTPLSATLSCGGVIEASLAVARGELKKTFAIVRPPGHHAEPDEHMGFCFFNNVAVAARVVQQTTPIKKILILDWDVHHEGNGTQKAFLDDPSVLYMSLHRYEGGAFYPCGPFGSLDSCGEGDGIGYSVNVPWPEAGMRDADYLHAFHKVIMPIAMEFAPELVIISAGFDAAEGDTLGGCHVTPAGYWHMTHMLSGLAGGRLVVALEGGYNLDSISNSALAVTRMILGEEPPELGSMVASESATETVWQVARQQSKYWKSVEPKAAEPREELEPLCFSIPELLKAHRRENLFRTHGMLEIPLVTQELVDRLGSQIMSTTDIMDNETMVVFAHEFGNIRAEIENTDTCNLNTEFSYMVDCSKELNAWIKSEKYSLLDVNLLPKPHQAAERQRRSVDELGRDLMTYLWDNYISLSNAKRVVLIGQGPGCSAMMELMQQRSTRIMKVVPLVVQVVGHGKIPATLREPEDLRKWYYKHSLVFIPKTHPMLAEGKTLLKRHGAIHTLTETKSVKLMMEAVPVIQSVVKQRLDSLPLRNSTANHINNTINPTVIT